MNIIKVILLFSFISLIVVAYIYFESVTAVPVINQDHSPERTVIVDKEDGDYKGIQQAVEWIKQNGNASKKNRWKVVVMPGVYKERVDLANGIDLVGTNKKKCILTWDGNAVKNEDTLRANYDTHIANLTILHNTNADEQDNWSYPIHIDSPELYSKVTLENLIVRATGGNAHHAIGMGLFGNQEAEIINSEFYSDNKPALYMHNSVTQSAPTRLVIKNSLVSGSIKNHSKNAIGLLIEDVNSNQPDRVEIQATEIKVSKRGRKLVVQPHPKFKGPRNTLSVRVDGELIKR